MDYLFKMPNYGKRLLANRTDINFVTTNQEKKTGSAEVEENKIMEKCRKNDRITKNFLEIILKIDVHIIAFTSAMVIFGGMIDFSISFK